MTGRARGLIAFLMLAAAAPAVGGDAPPVRFGEGWEMSAAVASPVPGEGDRCVAWVKGGWLQARREGRGGVIQWHIVLCRAEDPEPPTFELPPGTPRFGLSYRGGRYFIREDLNVLRCVRERKPSGVGAWPEVAFAAESYRGTGSAGGTNFIAGRVGPGGYVATAGPSAGRVDALVRLSSRPAESNWGFEALKDSAVRRAFFRDFWALDDGELLVSVRGLGETDSVELRVGDPAPDFTLERLDGGVVRLGELKGRHVLLDFWATWCGPCVAEFPHVRRVHEAYGTAGRLEVVGISLDEDPESARGMVRDRGLPWVQCRSGEGEDSAASRYGVSEIPATYLIGPDGKVLAVGLRGEGLLDRVRELVGAPGSSKATPK